MRVAAESVEREAAAATAAAKATKGWTKQVNAPLYFGSNDDEGAESSGDYDNGGDGGDEPTQEGGIGGQCHGGKQHGHGSKSQIQGGGRQ